MTRTFDKPALTVNEHIALLKTRGLLIADKPRAIRYLQFIGYYRLMAYGRPYQEDTKTNFFRGGTTFDDILKLYIFDRKLRLLTMDAIERLEVAVRTVINNHMTLKYSPFWLEDSGNFIKKYNHNNLINEIDKGLKKKYYPFYSAYYQHYDSPSRPPSWMISETLSFGQFSLIYAHLKFPADKKAIANTFNVPYVRFESWLQCLSTLRNICAHHGLLWNRKLPFAPSLPPELHAPDPDHYFIRVLVIWQLLSVVAHHSTWLAKLKELLFTCPRSISEMGFPDKWQLLAGF